MNHIFIRHLLFTACLWAMACGNASPLLPDGGFSRRGGADDTRDGDTATVSDTESTGEGDIDADADADVDADSDIDTDTDTDVDADSDVDGDAGRDTGTTGDTDKDGGADTDADTDVDGDGDSDTETDVDTDVDTDTGSDSAGRATDEAPNDAGIADGAVDDAGAADGGPDNQGDSGPRNVLLFIGDGMGFAHVDAASLYKAGETGRIHFESYPVRGKMSTYSASAEITDSAAASTAMGCGVKVNNGVIARAYPGDGADIENLSEFFDRRGKAVGLVTTVSITHATPAGMGAHADTRGDTATIASYYYRADGETGAPAMDVLFGANDGVDTTTVSGISAEGAIAAGFSVLDDFDTLARFDPQDAPVVGLFGSNSLAYEIDDGMPGRLTAMTEKALEVLTTNDNGFFLMVEGGLIDWASHSGASNSELNTRRFIHELLEMENAVIRAEGILAELGMLDDTLIVLTADHETGGVVISADSGAGEYPVVTFTASYHTAVDVPVYVRGPGAQAFANGLEDDLVGTIDNTDIHRIITGLYPD